jgi:hypothetical protein
MLHGAIDFQLSNDDVAKLRALTHALPTRGDLRDSMTEMQNTGDRAAALIGGALLENAMKVAILNHMSPMKPEEEDRLFETKLANFSDRVKRGRELGLFEEDIERLLHAMSRIRNAFAHAPIRLGFDTVPINKMCLSLPAIKSGLTQQQEWTLDAVADPRARFINVVLVLCATFVHPASFLLSAGTNSYTVWDKRGRVVERGPVDLGPSADLSDQ